MRTALLIAMLGSRIAMANMLLTDVSLATLSFGPGQTSYLNAGGLVSTDPLQPTLFQFSPPSALSRINLYFTDAINSGNLDGNAMTVDGIVLYPELIGGTLLWNDPITGAPESQAFWQNIGIACCGFHVDLPSPPDLTGTVNFTMQADLHAALQLGQPFDETGTWYFSLRDPPASVPEPSFGWIVGLVLLASWQGCRYWRLHQHRVSSVS